MIDYLSMILQKIVYQISVIDSRLCWVLVHRTEYRDVGSYIPDIGICLLVTEKSEPQCQRPVKLEAIKLSLFRVHFPIARYCNIWAFVWALNLMWQVLSLAWFTGSLWNTSCPDYYGGNLFNWEVWPMEELGNSHRPYAPQYIQIFVRERLA